MIYLHIKIKEEYCLIRVSVIFLADRTLSNGRAVVVRHGCIVAKRCERV